MTILNYIKLASQFFFRKAHTFTVRLGDADLTVKIEQEVANQVHIPFSISLANALTIVALIEDHVSVGSVGPNDPSFSFNAYVDGNIEVTITISKV
jgi:hypothetical protein